MENIKNKSIVKWQSLKNKIFFTDLDNTIIFSYKHNIGVDKVNIEMYQGREVSYMTKKTYCLLKQVAKKMLLVPVTTRTLEQYNRIDLGLGILPYALVCNGGIMLENGRENKSWYQQSLVSVQSAQAELQKALNLLEYDRRRIFELRFIRNLFVFTKCIEPDEVVCTLKKQVDLRFVDVLNNKNKIYVVPKALRKGESIKRLKRYIEGKIILAAGDSEFDISMLQAADIAFAPKRLADKYNLTDDFIVMPQKKPLSDEILEYIVKYVE